MMKDARDNINPVQATKLKKEPADQCLAQLAAMLTPPQKFNILKKDLEIFLPKAYLTTQENLRAPGTDERKVNIWLPASLLISITRF